MITVGFSEYGDQTAKFVVPSSFLVVMMRFRHRLPAGRVRFFHLDSLSKDAAEV